MKTHQLLAAYDTEMRIHPPYSRVRVWQRPGLTYVIDDGEEPRGGWVTYTHLGHRDIDEAIRERLEDASQLGITFEWTVYDQDTPGDLRERLMAQGFQPQEPEALEVLDMEDPTPLLSEFPSADIRIVADTAWLGAVMDVQSAVWSEDFSDLALRLDRDLTLEGENLSLYLAFVDGRPAATGWVRFFSGSRFAGLNGGTTLPAHRHRGLYTALVAIRAQEARARGVRFLAVDASPHSRPILEHLGFRFLTFSQPYVWKPSRRSRKPATPP